MKILMIAGSHPRHLYIMNRLIKTGCLVGVVMEKREAMIQEPPKYLSHHLTELYKYHFELRDAMEKKYFGSPEIKQLIQCIPIKEVEASQLNSEEVCGFIKQCRPDVIISYGPGLIRDCILDLVAGKAFNIHGGLSPYYKGSATMFWPFYFLEPNYVGTTIHYITKRIDGGNIIHQSIPELKHGDCMHEVSCRAIVAMGEDLNIFVELLDKGQTFCGEKQKKNGKLFLDRDWRPEHLKLIYDTYEDKIVDLFLDGVINQGNVPEIVKGW